MNCSISFNFPSMIYSTKQSLNFHSSLCCLTFNHPIISLSNTFRYLPSTMLDQHLFHWYFHSSQPLLTFNLYFHFHTLILILMILNSFFWHRTSLTAPFLSNQTGFILRLHPSIFNWFFNPLLLSPLQSSKPTSSWQTLTYGVEKIPSSQFQSS